MESAKQVCTELFMAELTLVTLSEKGTQKEGNLVLLDDSPPLIFDSPPNDHHFLHFKETYLEIRKREIFSAQKMQKKQDKRILLQIWFYQSTIKPGAISIDHSCLLHFTKHENDDAILASGRRGRKLSPNTSICR